jgi:hypothetical protein
MAQNMQPHNYSRSGPASTPHHGRDWVQPSDGALPLTLRFADMNAATDNGLVTILGSTAGFVVRYQDAWWIADDQGWVRVVVDEVAAILDAEHERLLTQNAIVARNAAIRAAVADEPGPS